MSGSNNRWALNERDVADIQAIHAMVRSWAVLATDNLTLHKVAHCLAVLEKAAAGDAPDALIEINVEDKQEGEDGLGCTLIIASDRIELASTEWFFMEPEGSHDHAWRPHAELTSSGDFNHEGVESWLFQARLVGADHKQELSVYFNGGLGGAADYQMNGPAGLTKVLSASIEQPTEHQDLADLHGMNEMAGRGKRLEQMTLEDLRSEIASLEKEMPTIVTAPYGSDLWMDQIDDRSTVRSLIRRYKEEIARREAAE